MFTGCRCHFISRFFSHLYKNIICITFITKSKVFFTGGFHQILVSHSWNASLWIRWKWFNQIYCSLPSCIDIEWPGLWLRRVLCLHGLCQAQLVAYHQCVSVCVVRLVAVACRSVAPCPWPWSLYVVVLVRCRGRVQPAQPPESTEPCGTRQCSRRLRYMSNSQPVKQPIHTVTTYHTLFTPRPAPSYLVTPCLPPILPRHISSHLVYPPSCPVISRHTLFTPRPAPSYLVTPCIPPVLPRHISSHLVYPPSCPVISRHTLYTPRPAPSYLVTPCLPSVLPRHISSHLVYPPSCPVISRHTLFTSRPAPSPALVSYLP